MRVLVVGSSGLVGAAIVRLLEAEGCTVVPFDWTSGQDVLDADALHRAAEGCAAIVNAARGWREAGPPGERYITQNVTGNWNVLEAARAAGAGMVVTFSSVNALGMFRGESRPDHFPIDDEHPVRPPTAYGVAKRLVEEMCRCFSATTGISTVVFRPPAVLGPERHAKYVALRAADPAAEWTPFWEYGCWIDTRDVARAVLAALRRPGLGHLTGLICADDTSSPVDVVELAARLMPDVPWRGGRAAPLVRCERVKRALDWAPRYRWEDAGVGEP
jgi:nucleoside-diphosphate-sugar epimerase